MSVNTTTEIT